MIGVVLWSDPQECKAVIWCEDHGDLAFFDAMCPPHCVSHRLDEGDLVEFDVETSQKLRFARNPRLLQEGACSNLTDVLTGQYANANALAGPDKDQPQSAEIVPLHPPKPRAETVEITSKTG